MKKLNKKGFTLIELIVVIGILAVLAVILIPSIMNYVSEARSAAGQANARSAYSTAALQVATNSYADADALEAAVIAKTPGLVGDKILFCVTEDTAGNVNAVTNAIFTSNDSTPVQYSFPTTGKTTCP